MGYEPVIEAMKQVFAGSDFGVAHTLDVLAAARDIMAGEDVSMNTAEVTTLAVICHDIGVVEARRKHGSMAAPYQEQEGPAVARGILEASGYEPVIVDRVCYIVGHHHTAAAIDGLDFQIVWEADLLINLKGREIRNDAERLPELIDANFRTATGRALAQKRFIVPLQKTDS